MLFNSFAFALFLPIVFGLYWFVVNKDLKKQNLLIVLASYFFYAYWDWRFLFLILFSSAVDFLVGLQLGKNKRERSRKGWLLLSISINLGLLGFFKYYNFFVEQFIAAFSGFGINLHLETLNIILPVGISFYTFQTLSYTIDVYRKRLKPVRDWPAFFAYVSFFPQLVAGPIERASNLLPQFTRPRVFDYEKAKDGMRQILWGLFKKMVIADSCALVVNDTFANYEQYGTGVLLLGIFFFAFQIYCDFSGYSDIAIGTARLFGINLMQNFAYPYFSRDIAEFWRRWHISLSTWFRDYVYIPLGGSRVKSKGRLIGNVLIIFLISGFWHGAKWTFIIWGLLNALFFLPYILFRQNRRHLGPLAEGRGLPDLKEGLMMLLTFCLISFTWVFFRAENLPHALGYLTQMVQNLSFPLQVLREQGPLIMGILIMTGIEWLQRNKQHAFEFSNREMNTPLRMGLYLSAALAILLFTPEQKSVFIYFQF